MKIFIGTSGYYFKDWIGNFYPYGINSKDFFSVYTSYFNTLEINSSYYKIHYPDFYLKLIEQAPPEFIFFTKFYKDFTHKRSLLYKRQFINSITEFLFLCNDKKYLKGLLAQLPFSFKYSEKNIEYILLLNKITKEISKELTTIIEFRHIGWYKKKVLNLFHKEGIVLASVDEPNIEGLPNRSLYDTGEFIYIRMHSRNKDKWFTNERYNYSYSKEELLEWKNKIIAYSELITNKTNAKKNIKEKNVFIFFNNCHIGKAAADAIVMSNIINNENIKLSLF